MYNYLEVSKQSVYQMLARYEDKLLKSQQFIKKAEAIRKDHPEISCRKMALMLRESGWGRDKTEALFISSGFRVSYPPNYTKTTHSVRVHRFDNLIEGMVIKDTNKIVQTDITYLWANNRFYYLVFIIDVYSRLIVGYHASDGLEAEANIKALEMMINYRGKENIKGLIHHSDKGSQYNCKDYLNILKDHKIKVSMCNEAWQNAYGERINRTIKHEYLRHKNIKSLQALRQELDRTINLYNTQRPHLSLPGTMTPAAFEKYVNKIPKNKRFKMMIYKPTKELSTKQL